MNTPTAIDQLYDDYILKMQGDSEDSAAALNECRVLFAKSKPRATKREVDDAEDTVYNYGAIERREGFIDVFKLAVKLMGEVYAAPDGCQRGEST